MGEPAWRFDFGRHDHRRQLPPLSFDDHLSRAARGFDPLSRGGAESMRGDRQRLGQLAFGQDLHRDSLSRAETMCVQRLERNVGPGLKPRFQVAQVHDLRLGPEALPHPGEIDFRQLRLERYVEIIILRYPIEMFGVGCQIVQLMQPPRKFTSANDSIERRPVRGPDGDLSRTLPGIWDATGDGEIDATEFVRQ